MIGQHLGPYHVLAKVGEGGMGEVYRARDTNLGRDVALKTLPAELAGDETRRSRFEREARVLASLNHPNVVTIHSVERFDGQLFLTMELVPGQPLSRLIPPTGLPLDKLLAIALPVTEAMSAAHAGGILHRDLKPANIMVTPQGTVKVLDFGLAKSLEPRAEATVTLSALTEAGHVVGTVAYMSPEQAEGKTVDQRSDVFSLGVILYEMATGVRPFTGDTPLATLTSILRDTPVPASARNPSVPNELGRIIRRALAKDPERRQQTVKDLRNDLDELRQDVSSGQSPATTAAARTTTSRTWMVLLLLGSMAVAIAAAVWPRSSPSIDTSPAGGPTAFTMAPITSEDGLEIFPSLSPDGKWIVYTRDEKGTGQTDIFLRAVGALTAINLTADSSADDLQPVFSPDGERVLFRSERDGGGLFIMGRTGDSVRRVSTEGFNPSWSPDGASIVYANESITTNPGARFGFSPTLGIVSIATGDRRELTLTDAVQPSWSPLGRRIAFWGMARDSSQRDIWTVAVTGEDPVPVTNDAAVDWNPVWSPDGRHLYYVSNRSGAYTLWRVAIDEATGQPRAAPEPVPLPRSSVAHLSFAADGAHLAMASFADQANLEAIAINFRSPATVSRRRLTNRSESGIVSPNQDAPSVSADGQWLVASHVTVDGRTDLWVVRADGTGLRQLTDDAYRDANPSWFPDGRRIMFRTDRSGRFQVWTISADGGGLTQVTDLASMVLALALSPDGRNGVAATSQNSVMFDPGAAVAGQRLAELPAPQGPFFAPTSWSPDGTRIAGFTRDAIVVYSVSARRYESFVERGQRPSWLPDSRTLIYTTGRELRALDTVTKVSTVLFASPTEMLGGPVYSAARGEIYLVIVKPQGDIVLAEATRP
jgi:Tol biopolymer transport system component